MTRSDLKVVGWLGLLGVGILGSGITATHWPPRAAERALRASNSQPAPSIEETEPNDTPAQASLVAFGDTVSGTIDPATDVDYFAVDIADTVLLRTELRSTYSTSMRLLWYDPDGTTLLDSTGFETAGWVSQYSVTVPGRYYVAVRGGPLAGTYELSLQAAPPGAGDPVSVVAEGLGFVRAVAALPSGDLAVANDDGRIFRVSPAGQVSTLATVANAYNVAAMVVDGFGNILVASQRSGDSAPIIWRITPTGEQSVFLLGFLAEAMAVAPDGYVWVSGCVVTAGPPCQLRRYSPFGKLSAATDGVLVARLAFSPTGDLYGMNNQQVARLGGTVAPVITDPTAIFTALAFDEDGYLYVADAGRPAIRLYTPSFERVGDALALTSLRGFLELAFARVDSETMAARLFATNSGYRSALLGTLLEVNPAGVRAPGWPLGASVELLSLRTLERGLLGVPYTDTLSLQTGAQQADWSIIDGRLPYGLTLDGATGVITGVPGERGIRIFTLRTTIGGRWGYGESYFSVREPVIVGSPAEALLGKSDAITDTARAFLDFQGNGNGRFDIGDLRAWILSHAVGNADAVARDASVGWKEGAR